MNGIMMRISDSFPWECPTVDCCSIVAVMHMNLVPLGPYGETVRDLMLAGF